MKNGIQKFLLIVLAACFALTGCDGNGELLTDLAGTLPGAPGNLVADTVTDTVAIDLAWDPGESADRYRIYRAEASFDLGAAPRNTDKHEKTGISTPKYQILAEVSVTASVSAEVTTVVYRDNQVTAGNEYFYRVSSLSTDGDESLPSNLASAIAGVAAKKPVLSVPKSEADLATFKNTKLIVDLKALLSVTASEGATPEFSVSTQPNHGTVTIAGNSLTLDPEENYDGMDAVSLEIGAGAATKASVVLSIEIVNRVPTATVSGIATLAEQTGQVQIAANDADPNDPLTYTIVTPAGHGLASVSQYGLVTFQPDPGFLGADSIVVAVRDSSDTGPDLVVNIAVDTVPVGLVSPNLPAAVSCTTDVAHVALTDIIPAPGTVLTSGTSVTFTARFQYALPATTTLGLYFPDVGGRPTKSVSVPAGCGSTNIIGSVTIPARTGMQVTTLVQKYGVFYPIDSVTAAPGITVEGASLPAGYYFDQVYADFWADIGWDMYGRVDQAVDYGNEVAVRETSGNKQSYLPYSEQVANTGTVRTRMLSLFTCGQTSAGWSFKAEDQNHSSYAYLNYQIVPPAVAFNDFIREFPLNGTDVSVDLKLSDCVPGGSDVWITASDSWFDFGGVAKKNLSLPATLTVDLRGAGKAPGLALEGMITVTSATGAFAPVEFPISARTIDVDLAGYNVLGIKGDDIAGTISLPFSFPVAGTSTSEVVVQTNGSLFFGQVTGNGSANDFNAPYASFDQLDPYHWGPAILGFWWGDNAMYNQDNGEAPVADVYYKEVTDSSGHYMDIFWYDGNWYTGYATHNVIEIRLYSYGRIQIVYHSVYPYGHERIATYTRKGVMADQHDVLSIRAGDVINFGPIAAD